MRKRHLYKIKRPGGASLVLSVLLFAGIVALFFGALRYTKRSSAAKEMEQLETALRRACVTCYAVEGRYPKNVQYMVERYGVVVDNDLYVVRYDAFADNLMPDISVIRKEAAE